MRHDKIEFGRARTAARRLRAVRKPAGDRSVIRAVSDSAPTTVIDEAFAGFDRIESCPEPQTTTKPRRQMVNQLLVARLAEQLEALDCQREQLAQLLRSIDAS